MPITVLNTTTGVDFQTPSGLTLAPTAGSDRMLVVAGGAYRSAAAIRTVSDMTLNGTSSDFDSSNSSSAALKAFACGFLDANIGAGDLAITWSTADLAHNGFGAVLELDGVAQSSFLGQEASAFQSSGTTLTTAAITVSAGDILIVSTIKNTSADYTTFDGSGFTVFHSATPTMNATARRVKAYYKIISSGGSETLTWTWSGTTSAMVRAVVLQPASGASDVDGPILFNRKTTFVSDLIIQY